MSDRIGLLEPRHAIMAARWSLTGPETLAPLGEPLSDRGQRCERLWALLGAHRSLLLLATDPTCCAKLLREPHPSLDDPSMLAQGLAGIARAHLLARLGR